MSKRKLRAISKQTEEIISSFNEDNKLQARLRSLRVGHLKAEARRAYDKAVESDDLEMALELLDQVEPIELYLYMPDLMISDSGSIKLLNVRAYSAQVKDDILLHKLFSKTREQS